MFPRRDLKQQREIVHQQKPCTRLPPAWRLYISKGPSCLSRARQLVRPCLIVPPSEEDGKTGHGEENENQNRLHNCRCRATSTTFTVGRSMSVPKNFFEVFWDTLAIKHVFCLLKSLDHCLTISWTELESLSKSWVRPKRMGFPWTSELAIYIFVKQPRLRILGFGTFSNTFTPIGTNPDLRGGENEKSHCSKFYMIFLLFSAISISASPWVLISSMFCHFITKAPSSAIMKKIVFSSC